MTKSDLTARLAAKNPALPLEDVQELVNLIFDTIAESLANGNRIEIRNFGVFTPRERKSRIARNPKTGEPVSVSEKVVVHFKAGKEIRERINADHPIPDTSESPDVTSD